MTFFFGRGRRRLGVSAATAAIYKMGRVTHAIETAGDAPSALLPPAKLRDEVPFDLKLADVTRGRAPENLRLARKEGWPSLIPANVSAGEYSRALDADPAEYQADYLLPSHRCFGEPKIPPAKNMADEQKLCCQPMRISMRKQNESCRGNNTSNRLRVWHLWYGVNG